METEQRGIGMEGIIIIKGILIKIKGVSRDGCRGVRT